MLLAVMHSLFVPPGVNMLGARVRLDRQSWGMKYSKHREIEYKKTHTTKRMRSRLPAASQQPVDSGNGMFVYAVRVFVLRVFALSRCTNYVNLINHLNAGAYGFI